MSIVECGMGVPSPWGSSCIGLLLGCRYSGYVQVMLDQLGIKGEADGAIYRYEWLGCK